MTLTQYVVFLVNGSGSPEKSRGFVRFVQGDIATTQGYFSVREGEAGGV